MLIQSLMANRLSYAQVSSAVLPLLVGLLNLRTQRGLVSGPVHASGKCLRKQAKVLAEPLSTYSGRPGSSWSSREPEHARTSPPFTCRCCGAPLLTNWPGWDSGASKLIRTDGNVWLIPGRQGYISVDST